MVRSMKKAFLVFSGFNQRAIIAFIRTLENNNINYYIVASGYNDPIFQTNYLNHVVFTRENNELSLSYIKKIIQSVKLAIEEKLIFAPSTEGLNRFFLNNRTFFEKLGLIIPLVEQKLYESISDKKSFGELCQKYQIKIPAEIYSPASCSLPFIAKPISYSITSTDNLTPLLITTEHARKKLLTSKHFAHYFFQKFIFGRSFYLLLYISKKEIVFRFSQENLIQQPEGKSIIAALASEFHLTYESDKYINMLKQEKFHGLIMIEVRQHDNEYYMIEANPRFWGPSQLFVDAIKKKNLFDAFLSDLGFKVVEKEDVETRGQYFWFEGFIKTINSGADVIYHNYSSNQLASSLPNWIESDIYRRQDTMNIFLNSLKPETK